MYSLVRSFYSMANVCSIFIILHSHYHLIISTTLILLSPILLLVLMLCSDLGGGNTFLFQVLCLFLDESMSILYSTNYCYTDLISSGHIYKFHVKYKKLIQYILLFSVFSAANNKMSVIHFYRFHQVRFPKYVIKECNRDWSLLLTKFCFLFR